MGRRENRGLRLPSQAAPHALEFLAFIGARNHRQAEKHCVDKGGDYKLGTLLLTTPTSH